MATRRRLAHAAVIWAGGAAPATAHDRFEAVSTGTIYRSGAGNEVSRVVAGDSAAALVALGNHLLALQIVQTGFAQAFSLLMLVAAGLAASCGVLLFWLMGRAGKQSPMSIDAAVEHA
ncbi:hypothetical protein FHW67_001577 [Herbaspirillum sp. Sphag1AN]|uniref:hypothetical protein n=1 Tax=unclassified Herbaspirillum TaxID=2624150 RepID=UPI00161E3CF8|nr:MULTISPECIES: hypothetical protein [unclassified Herbaspirillum]MBB3212297.1 hypothetical protein [Herbaspirillum sp. Sphag1AN]MBB3245605.1 hypothetical protein [Herbaspirillum sp. Sphag64]